MRLITWKHKKLIFSFGNFTLHFALWNAFISSRSHCFYIFQKKLENSLAYFCFNHVSRFGSFVCNTHLRCCQMQYKYAPTSLLLRYFLLFFAIYFFKNKDNCHRVIISYAYRLFGLFLGLKLKDLFIFYQFFCIFAS